jgi:hypothetical protein
VKCDKFCPYNELNRFDPYNEMMKLRICMH